MVIAPRSAKQWRCKKCHWIDGYIQKSDCLKPHPEQCPKCGSSDFEMTDASPLENLLDKVGNLFR